MSKLPVSIRSLLLSKHRVFGRREYKLVKSRLEDNEYIKDSLYGAYQGGSGIVVATNKRMMLVDKRPFFDYIEESSYKDIQHLNYLNTSVGGALTFKINDTYFVFRSFKDMKVRSMFELLQAQVARRDKSSAYELAEIDTSGIGNEKIIKPLRRRVRKHPAWSPHNPIMTRVMTTSGVRLSED